MMQDYHYSILAVFFSSVPTQKMTMWGKPWQKARGCLYSGCMKSAMAIIVWFVWRLGFQSLVSV
jgi:hypothetical protein